MDDQFSAARGIFLGVAIGACFWIAVIVGLLIV